MLYLRYSQKQQLYFIVHSSAYPNRKFTIIYLQSCSFSSIHPSYSLSTTFQFKQIISALPLGLFHIFNMRKYKTIMPKPSNPLNDILSLQKQIDNYPNTEYTIETSPNSNKKIIVVNLPQSNHQHINNLPSSLYYTSLRRLKKQHSNHGKEIGIPEIGKKKRLEQLEQQGYKPYSINAYARNALPSLQLSSANHKNYREQEFLDDVVIQEFHKRHNRSLTLNEKRNSLSVQDQSLFQSKNLIRTKQSSKEKSKRDLHDKSQANILDWLQEQKGLQRKMSRQVEAHINRNHQINLHAKLDVFKTAICPIDKSPSKKSSLFGNDKEESYVRRKQLKSTLLYHASREKLNLFGHKQLSLRQYRQKSPIFGQRNEKLIDYTPWETDQAIFD